MTVTFEEAFKVVDDLVFAKIGRHLSKPEKIVMEGAWHNKGYEEIADDSPYSTNYLQRTVAPELWSLLAEAIGNGTQVGKKKIRYFLEQLTTKSYSQSLSNTKRLCPSDTPSHILGGQPPDVSSFYGRAAELSRLKELTLNHRCVVLYGATGIGKSSLVAKLIEESSAAPEPKFTRFVWKSIYYAPPLEDLVTDLVRLLAPQSEPEPDLPAYTQAKVSVLLKYMQSQRCLVVLDGAEAVLRGNRNNSFNPYGEQYAEYGIFLRRIIEELQQSCLILTSREPFNDINRLQIAGRPCYCLKLEGLNLHDATQILRNKGLGGEQAWEKLIQTYLGNPLAIELTANRIQNFFGSDVKNFFDYQTSSMISDFFQEALHESFGANGRLTNLEKQLLIYLAEELEKESADSIEFTKLLSGLKAREKNTATAEIMRALEALNERALIENRKSNKGELLFTLQPVVKKYVLENVSNISCSAA